MLINLLKTIEGKINHYMKQQPNKIHEITVQSLSHDGRGIGKIAGKTVFIDNALEGEHLLIQIERHHRRYDEAKVVEILTRSPDRVEPLCPHFTQCGGCQLQHLSHEKQIVLKQSLLIDQLQRFGNVAPNHILPPLLGLEYGYRRKARLGVRFVNKKDKLLIGFREKNSNKIADLSRCETLDPCIGLILPELAGLISSLQGFKVIPQIEIAIGDNEAALVFRHLEPLSNEDKAAMANFVQLQNQLAMERGAKKYKILLQPGDAASIIPLLPDDTLNLSYTLKSLNIHFTFQPLDFVQVNAIMNEKMINRVLEHLELSPQDRALDLFCGIGNFTLPMGKFAREVAGVEGEALAIARAKENAARNGITNVEFHVQNLQCSLQDKIAAENKTTAWLHQSYDKILLDPPRTGAAEILGSVAAMGAKKIVYVSCNPATLARDLGILCHEYEYRLEAVGVMDMFSQTSHLESIAVLKQ